MLKRTTSIAAAGEGTEDPETVENVTVENEDDEILVIFWHGNEYSRGKTWIQADKTDVYNLEAQR